MPSWGGKIPDQQLWEISAYVKALSQGGRAQCRPKLNIEFIQRSRTENN